MSSVISSIGFHSLLAHVPRIMEHMMLGDTADHDIDRDVYVIRNERGDIRGSYNPVADAFTQGLPYWLDPMNSATIRAAAMPAPVHDKVDLDESLMGYAAVPVYGSVAVSPAVAEYGAMTMSVPDRDEALQAEIDATEDVLAAIVGVEVDEPEPVIAMADSPQDDLTSDEILDEIFGAEATISGEGESDRFDEIEADLEASLFGSLRIEPPDDNDNTADDEPVKSQGDILLDMLLDAAQKGELKSFSFTTYGGVNAGWGG